MLTELGRNLGGWWLVALIALLVALPLSVTLATPALAFEPEAETSEQDIEECDWASVRTQVRQRSRGRLRTQFPRTDNENHWTRTHSPGTILGGHRLANGLMAPVRR